MTCNWVDEEMTELNTGDERLNKRAKSVISVVMKKPNMPFTNQFQTTAELKACYRLFDSDLITSESLLKPHLTKTIERIKTHDVVVISSDTSSVNYTTRSSNPDSGYLSANNAQGFFLHTSLATTLDRVPLGVVSSKFWAREKEKSENKTHRDYLPIEEKESFKWIESYCIANEVANLSKTTEVIYVADKEADIIDLWEEGCRALEQKHASHLVVRCNHNRAVLPTLENDKKKLFDFGKKAPVVGMCEFELRDRKTHKILRTVRQEIKASPVSICPAYRSGVNRRQVDLNLVFLHEIDPPEGVKPVFWYLLTTLPVATQEDVTKVIQAYLARWDIEVLFRTFKTGCRVENRSLRTADRLYPMFALFLIIAWRINYLSRLCRTNPNLPCTVFFSETEWKAAWAAITKSAEPRTTVPTIQEMIIIVARLGGYLNRKNDPAPGPTVIWRGLEYLHGFAEAWEILQSTAETQNIITVKKSYG